MNDPVVVRVWDLPTRLFHWLLAVGVIGSIVTARIGGGAMTWHFRIGYVIFALVVFRLLWGVVGGHWSRFRAFVYAPASGWRYLRGRSQAHEHHDVGHSPVGALSVFALLGLIAVQVGSGLLADDEIASSGPLVKFVSGATSAAASRWHKDYGQWILVTLIVLHVAAIAYYWLRRRRNLVGPMLHGDKLLTRDVPASVDTWATRWLALALVAACGAGVYLVQRLGD
jgi:cytochrome b